MHHGAVRHAAGYGLADLATKTPITAETVFHLASLSKPFTAMAVLLLAERQQLHLEDNIRKFLPETPKRQRAIRVTDLLRHTHGLSEGFDWTKSDKFPQLRNEDVLRRVAKKPLAYPTGTKMSYSNAGYALLSLIVERVSGKRFARFMRDEIFQPLEMKHSYVRSTNRSGAERHANGYQTSRANAPLLDAPIIRAHGAINVFSTLRDMSRWEAALRLGGPPLVSPHLLHAAFRPGKLLDGAAHGYGYGWWQDYDLDEAVYHGGKWDGFRASHRRYLARELGVIVLANFRELDPHRLAVEVKKTYDSATRIAPAAYSGKWSGTWSNSANESGTSSLVLSRRSDGSFAGAWDKVPVVGHVQDDGGMKLTGANTSRSYELTGRIDAGALYLNYLATNLSTTANYRGSCELRKE